MEEPLHVVAAAKWIALGATSATNPIHRFVIDQFFAPLGIRCDYMDCDPVSDPNESALPVFFSPKWSRLKTDEPFQRMLPSLEVFDLYTVTISVSGVLEFSLLSAGTIPAAVLPLVDRFDNGEELNALIQKSRGAASRFLVKAFDVACMPPPDSRSEMSTLLINDPAAFGPALWRDLLRA